MLEVRRQEQKRFEVLDRLARHKTGLSLAQKSDFQRWKDAWDDAMVNEHKGGWANTFAGWMQNILDSAESNSFSKFMYDETGRVFSDSTALAVPG